MKRLIEQWASPWGEVYQNVRVYRGEYPQAGGMGVSLTSDEGEPLASVSVNLSFYGLTPDEGCIFVKDYAEGEGMLDSLTEAGLLEPTGRTVTFGPYDTTAREARVL